MHKKMRERVLLMIITYLFGRGEAECWAAWFILESAENIPREIA